VSPHAQGTSRRADVLFDIRTVIGALFAVYGVVCLVAGLVSFTAADRAKTGGVNLNLWTGLGMLVLSAAFLIWSFSRPLHPDEDAAAAADGAGSTPADGGSSTGPDPTPGTGHGEVRQ